MMDILSVGSACSDVTVTVRRDDLLTLAELAVSAADEIELNTDDRYPLRFEQRAQMRRYERDMQLVRDFRAAIRKLVKTEGDEK